MLPGENSHFKNKFYHACVWSNSNSLEQIPKLLLRLTTGAYHSKIKDKVCMSHDHRELSIIS